MDQWSNGFDGDAKNDKPVDSITISDASNKVSLPPGPNHEERLTALRAAGAAGRNVLLLASGELLRALAEVPQQLDEVQIRLWRELLEAELLEFTRLCERLNVRRDHMLAARYVLCTALDEAASLAPWNTRGERVDIWANLALLPQFHGERDGGEVVFMLLGRMANAPQEHAAVLELIHHVLSLGFMGHYASKGGDGHRQLESIRHRLFTMVADGQTPVPRELSAHWRGASTGQFRLLRAVPVWASASLLALVLLAQFGWSKYQLLSSSTDLEKRIHALRQLQPDEPQVKAQALGLPQLLAEEIAQGRVTVQEDATHALVVFKGDGMFASGQAGLSPASQALVAKVGQALKAVSGKVVVTGHTDNIPSPDPQGFNRALSTSRAKVVAQALQAQGVEAQRLDVVGKGADEPVASNDTNAGRAQNRRVVIEVFNGAK
jgi:type VI secretion system protein ImpK